jgi:dipeptidyl-peptidase-4
MQYLLIYTGPWKSRISECVTCREFPDFLLMEELILSLTDFPLLAAVTALSLSTFPLAAQSPAKPLTVEAIYAHGPLIGTQPDGLAWSPDGKHLTYMVAGELSEIEPGSDDAYVIVNRAKLASFSGAGASEQDRDHRERYKMASYLWAPDSQHLLFDMSGSLWFYDLHSRAGVEVALTGAASGDDPKFSPNGESISFIREHGLAVVRLKEPGTPMTMVAPAPNKTTLNGEVDWVYEEELDVRSNYFWSPDSKRLAYLEMNEAEVPEYPITDWIPTHATVDVQRYPQPGDPNPAVRVGVVSAQGGKTVWVSLPFRAGQDYIPRFGWVDAKTVWIETLARDQRHRDIYFADADTGLAHAVLQLTDDKFSTASTTFG